MKTTYLTILFNLLAAMLFGQIDTSHLEHFENKLLGNSSIIQSNINDPVRIADGPPEHPPINHPYEIQEYSTLKRLVFFIHGLGGSTTAWERAATALMDPNSQGVGFNARWCETFRLGYDPSYSTITAAAIDMKQDITLRSNIYNALPGYDPDKSKNFIIAHSQGGVITRTMAHNDILLGREGYGGYVTVSSSLQGAQIINNIPNLLSFANDGCKQMLEGQLTEVLPVTQFNQLNDIMYVLNKKIVNTTCSAVSGLIPELFKDFTYNLTNDYKVGAAHINTLNNTAYDPSLNDLHKVAFYGVEPKENLIWRTLTWMLQDVNDEEPWMANEDFYLLNTTVIPLRNKYFANHFKNETSYLVYQYLANCLLVPDKWNPMLKTANGYKKKSLAWYQGVNWLDRANSSWTAIIGALDLQPAGSSCLCIYMENGKVKELLTSDCEACTLLFPTNLLSADPITLFQWTYKENDGIVLAESAKDLPGATGLSMKLNGIEESGKEPTGSSHFQVRNDIALRNHLSDLLDGNIDKWFRTQKQ
jgi:pimeloyl-ACP methyl ester carboxylesterase